MKLRLFLKDKIIYIVSNTCLLLFLGFILNMLKVTTSLIILICSLELIIVVVPIIIDYIKRNKYYSELYKTINKMDKKQYIAEMLNEATFADAEILSDILRITTKAMNDEINTYKLKEEEYREYIETWIHEVKLPISCISLICDNNKNEVTSSIIEEKDRIEKYVEQALYYTRSMNIEKDYSIKKIKLSDIVKSCIKKNSKQLIACKTKINMDNIYYDVYSDSKWLDFILGQIISNSIKYSKDELELSFKAEEDLETVKLYIIDNGIGIPVQDIGRVFNKGFTGENGRKFSKSTGIGLYLCKELCRKLYIDLKIKSEESVGTTIIIIFPKNKLVMLEE